MAEKYVKLVDVKRKVNYILTRNGCSPQTQRAIKDVLNNLPYTVKAELETTLEAADIQTANCWISCKDNMPDTLERGLSTMYSDCCLVCDAFGWVGMAYYVTDGQKSWWEFADAQNQNKIDWTEVTHWQPLPEPPEV